jgi:hypothetical protein
MLLFDRCCCCCCCYRCCRIISLTHALSHYIIINRLPAAAAAPRLDFHVSARRESEAVAPPVVEIAEVQEEKPSFWENIYGVPVGIAFAVPAIHYEWYIVNEETQLAACFIAFTAIVYKQFGGAIHDMLQEDGVRILEEHNKLEDAIIHDLQDKLYDVQMQEHVVQDAMDIKELRVASYVKLNAAGIIKPQFEFKAQMERLLTMMAAEEVSMQEKTKAAIMEEARVSVTAEFSTNKELKKTSLASAIAQLKGSSGQSDPVKAAYLSFFKTKGVAAAKIDEKVELEQNRASMIGKMNAIASNEGFFFELDAAGKPKMTV